MNDQNHLLLVFSYASNNYVFVSKERKLTSRVKFYKEIAETCSNTDMGLAMLLFKARGTIHYCIVHINRICIMYV